jgi:hypothetical protein
MTQPRDISGIAEYAVIAGTDATVTPYRKTVPARSAHKTNREAWQLPDLLFWFCLQDVPIPDEDAVEGAHRKSGMIYLIFGSKPGGVILLLQSFEATIPFYSADFPIAR